MSFKGVVEFALQIEGFRNIDLFHQGLYQIRFSIYHVKNGQRILAHPYHAKEKPIKDSKKKDTKAIIAPHIIDETSAYVTRTFLIRFCDEETDLNEVCHFRTEYDAFPDIAEATFYIEAELLFADLGKLSQPKNGKEDSLAAFKSISLYKAKINNLHLGVNEYLPVLFDDSHFCVLHTMFHAVLMDFKFRTSPIEAFRDETFLSTEGEERKPINIIPPPKNFTEFLDRNTLKFQKSELEKFYVYYIKGLKRSYEKLVRFHAYALKFCFREKNKAHFTKYLEEAPFKDLISDYLNKEGPWEIVKLHFSEIKEELMLPEKPSKLFDSFPDKKIDELINPEDPSNIANVFLQEVNFIAGNTFQAWYLFIEMMMDAPKIISTVLREEYYKQLRDRWGESIFQQKYKVPDLSQTFEQKLGENHKQIALSRRNNLSKILDDYNSIQDINMFPKPEFHPIVFEELYVREKDGQEAAETIFNNIEKNYLKNEYKGIHLMILCHGFQGNSFDLRCFKNNISYLYPDTMFLCASANEDLTDGEIAGMGVRLANEVKNYIDEWVPGNNLGRLSFVGHSLGGLIIRSALPYLEQYASKMHLYMTLSSPHLGYMYQSSKLVDAGMWVLKKWKKSTCLKELTMTDAEKIEDTYLYKLSKNKGLGWFKIVAFLSSYQDQYAPFESARIQVGKKSSYDSKSQAYAQMAKNILSEITTDYVYRIDVNFKMEEKNLDSMIGRAAHIKFLESQALMRMLVYRFANFFA